MSLVRVAGLCRERGQPPTLARGTRKPQKVLETHDPFKPLWSVADRGDKAATQLPAADREVPRCLARAAHAEGDSPPKHQYGEEHCWVGRQRSSAQGRAF